MKVMVGEFVTESNANVPTKCILDNYDIGFGSDCINKMRIKEVFEKNEVELIPSIFANAGPAGVITRPTFDYLESVFLDTVKENINELDGIFLMLHGASEVEEIGSGDHHILKEIRKIVGPYLPIAVVCDPHGNLCKEYVESIQILRSYRESPHTDADETMVKVAQMLCDLLNNRQNIHSVYRKLPLILGGEQSVSTDEPVRSINQYLDELEKDERILSASWHVGYLRHDCPEAGCGIIVIPNDEKDKDYASEVADRLARYVWDKRHEFHYTGLTMQFEDAFNAAIEMEEGPVFLTDSGDNVTSGAMGVNTMMLREFLKKDLKNKSVLFAAIQDQKTYNVLSNKNIGDQVDIQLGINLDDLSRPVPLHVTIKHKGRQVGTKMFGEIGDFGGCITVSVTDAPIDIIITDSNHPFVEMEEFKAAGVDYYDYAITVVKIGYAFPELVKNGKKAIMVLTDGATIQDTTRLPFKLIMRPMYPIDEI